ncbi:MULTISPECIES: ArsR/SmtB family transcription factor [unclassified Romboutsia]|uniref:ArsR/SmtB family transcription factor n=1 Tax=unclassified Romboutsia TaxID=2626894 RepID=UPI000820D61F|nr:MULTISPECIES: metalloregulator ArsR/SmtB family transcription factor [unclassified Romboutsia]SCI16410.1 HTH-type transcriptional repressor CzrA [uncultured Clostridium sp.]
MENLSKVFKALSDETRLKILVLASKRNICQKGISKLLGISDSAVSQHIKILKDVGILKGIKEGYFVFYTIDKEIFDQCISFIKFIKNDSVEDILEYNEFKEIHEVGCKINCKALNKCCKKGGF